jgi:hypothetical protein
MWFSATKSLRPQAFLRGVLHSKSLDKLSRLNKAKGNTLDGEQVNSNIIVFSFPSYLKMVQQDAPKSSRKFDFHLLLNKLKYFIDSTVVDVHICKPSS